ncbi:MAG: patatin-like phospholipase family protein [Paludibacteraceae bacterium]
MNILSKISKSITSSVENLIEDAQTPKTVGICLGGGGALGYAHIGVLQALEDLDIYPQIISGSSMGAIIGSLYAAGITPQQMLQFIKEDKLYRISKLISINPKFWERSGLINNTNLKSLFKQLIPENSFDKLKRPLYICVSNLSTGESNIVYEGDNLNSWIVASSAIPGVFNAVEIKGNIYADGGLFNNMPVHPLKERCDVIIGSDVLPYDIIKKDLKIKDAFAAAIRAVEARNSDEGRSLCDFLIEPKGIEKYHEFSFEFYMEIYQYGYSEVTKFVTNHPEILKLKSGK